MTNRSGTRGSFFQSAPPLTLRTPDHYRRIDLSDLPTHHPIRRFEDSYRRLPAGRRFRLWSAFDIACVDPDIVPHLILAAPLDRPSDTGGAPKKFIYRLSGYEVESLTGRPMKGVIVGELAETTAKSYLAQEIEAAYQNRSPVYSLCLMETPKRPAIGYHRAIYLFEEDDGDVARLLQVLARVERPLGD